MSAPRIGDLVYFGLVQVSEAKIIQELENQYLVEYADNTVNYWKKDGICRSKVECLDILINLLVKQKELETADASASVSDVIEGAVVEHAPVVNDALPENEVSESSAVEEVINEV